MIGGARLSLSHTSYSLCLFKAQTATTRCRCALKFRSLLHTTRFRVRGSGPDSAARTDNPCCSDCECDRLGDVPSGSSMYVDVHGYLVREILGPTTVMSMGWKPSFNAGDSWRRRKSPLSASTNSGSTTRDPLSRPACCHS